MASPIPPCQYQQTWNIEFGAMPLRERMIGNVICVLFVLVPSCIEHQNQHHAIERIGDHLLFQMSLNSRLCKPNFSTSILFISVASEPAL